LQAWTIAILGGLGALLIGLAVALVAIRSRGPREPEPEKLDKEDSPQPAVESEPDPDVLDLSRVPGLVAEALRGPLAQLRRLKGCPPELREPLERLGTRLRLLDARPRPMRATPTAPILLLQDVAEEVPLLRTGSVGVSWSLRTRIPALLDAERARLAFRELLYACAEGAQPGGRVGIRVLGNPDPTHPLRIEIEIGRRFAEVDPLALLVVRHLLEAQGGIVQVDARITRILLRVPEKDEEETASPQTGES
jgi:hypothetical protein